MGCSCANWVSSLKSDCSGAAFRLPRSGFDGRTPEIRLDYDTGHMDFAGDAEVVIGTSVLRELTIKDRGSMTVEQAIEAGTRVQPAAPTAVSGSFAGNKTRPALWLRQGSPDSLPGRPGTGGNPPVDSHCSGGGM